MPVPAPVLVRLACPVARFRVLVPLVLVRSRPAARPVVLVKALPANRRAVLRPVLVNRPAASQVLVLYLAAVHPAVPVNLLARSHLAVLPVPVLRAVNLAALSLLVVLPVLLANHQVAVRVLARNPALASRAAAQARSPARPVAAACIVRLPHRAARAQALSLAARAGSPVRLRVY